MELRALDPDTDQHLFREAYDWIFEAPKWLRQAENIVAGINGCDSWEGYLKAAYSPQECNVGLFSDFSGIMQALFTIQSEGDGCFQVHVNARPHAETSMLVAAAIQLKEWLFQAGAKEVFGYVAERNRPLKKFAEQVGFKFSGVSIFKGSMRDRPIRWMRYTALREA